MRNESGCTENTSKKNILQEIAERTKKRVNERKKSFSFEAVKEAAFAADAVFAGYPYAFPFESSLRGGDISFICEVKKASPSKGIIAKNFPYIDIARDYEAAGAAAVSVLTEPFYFKGSDEHLSEIAENVKIPLLRKDFTVDEYMIYESKLLGANAVLFICSILDAKTLAEYIKIAHKIGLSALVETHDEHEVEMALAAGARIIGVNNRDLKTFEIDITLSERLKKLVPQEIIFVSESGISTPEDIQKLRDIGADAALIGENLMRSTDKKAAIDFLRNGKG
ncbi:MAG: indole-3-glycerol phosphate synthase TrpC [Defluviitaleaceae bacterium]|nr:indole-3-glycerol phosphate synthase TrpC [Defluviitaleaceae bacterium]